MKSYKMLKGADHPSIQSQEEKGISRISTILGKIVITAKF